MRKFSMTPELSKAVGWEPQKVLWPSMDELKSALDIQILKWHRFLPSAETPEQKQVQYALHQMVTGSIDSKSI